MSGRYHGEGGEWATPILFVMILYAILVVVRLWGS